MTSSLKQETLFGGSPLPNGFVYQPDFLTRADEERLLAEMGELPLQEALYKTFTAKRRIVSFGSGYDFTTNAPTAAPPIPILLRGIRERAARWAAISDAQLTQCTVAEYSPGAQLGWHRDVPTFGIVIGISLASPCRMRFRPYPHVKHTRVRSQTIVLEPRSIYVLRDEARWRWQHAISPTKALRYSITFRTTAERRSPRGS
jgi:alkylated DNA repair dioxygenase AlkB